MSKGQATLDDPAAVRAADPGGMLSLVAELGTHLGAGFALGRRVRHLPTAEGLGSIVVCGMGGSGIVGDVLKASFANRLPVPVTTVKGYRIPAFCDKDTLVLAVSYSGDTEETLAAFAQAVAMGCRMIAVSSGGQLAELARTNGASHVPIARHIPAPRAALGYLVGASLGVLEAVGVVADVGPELDGASRVLGALSTELSPDRSVEENRAKSLGKWLLDRIPVVWGSEGVAEAAALRWKTQFNENAKVPAFHAVLPELDHNEIEGWSEQTGGPFGLLVLRHDREHPRISRRLQATMDAIAGSGLECREVAAEGSTPIEILLSFVMLADFASTYLAILRGVDPMPVEVLTRLKERLRG
jgi:glucose/mannose-6-phosphate isomerase